MESLDKLIEALISGGQPSGPARDPFEVDVAVRWEAEQVEDEEVHVGLNVPPGLPIERQAVQYAQHIRVPTSKGPPEGNTRR